VVGTVDLVYSTCPSHADVAFRTITYSVHHQATIIQVAKRIEITMRRAQTTQMHGLEGYATGRHRLEGYATGRQCASPVIE